jgi:hypothetical protein
LVRGKRGNYSNAPYSVTVFYGCANFFKDPVYGLLLCVGFFQTRQKVKRTAKRMVGSWIFGDAICGFHDPKGPLQIDLCEATQ